MIRWVCDVFCAACSGTRNKRAGSAACVVPQRQRAFRYVRHRTDAPPAALLERDKAEERIPISRHIDRQGGFVVIDFRGCDSRGVSEIYQVFALLCAREEVRRALL